MILRWLLAALHLLGLGIGLGAVLDRARALRSSLDERQLRRAFRADTFWGVAAFLVVLMVIAATAMARGPRLLRWQSEAGTR